MSHECTRDQYPFNGQMRTGTGTSLIYKNGDQHYDIGPLCKADLCHNADHHFYLRIATGQ